MNRVVRMLSVLGSVGLVLLLLVCCATAKSEQVQNYFLISNLEGVKGTVTTDKGPQDVVFWGEIAFQVLPGQDGGVKLNLARLNLVTSGVTAIIGDCGGIGLTLAEPEYEADYDTGTGQLTSNFRLTLHYGLIDRIKGYIPDPSKECAVFDSYRESMKGALSGRLPESLQMVEKGSASFEGNIAMELAEPVVGAIRNIQISLLLGLSWVALWDLEPAEILRVQPIFIGSGPADPTATGTAVETLIRRAAEIWNRCGTVHCIKILVNEPIYLDNDAYRVLSGEAEAIALMGAVDDVTDALEVFVVERWDPYYDGGGATWGGGTASTKIVTCDQQLDVPCPTPCSTCGDINYYHLAHEIGHALDLLHPGDWRTGRAQSSPGSVMEPSGFCADNPNVQSARNCRNANNPLLYWGRGFCTGSPDIMD